MNGRGQKRAGVFDELIVRKSIRLSADAPIDTFDDVGGGGGGGDVATHAAEANIHRSLDDGVTSTTTLWSSSKISDSIAGRLSDITVTGAGAKRIIRPAADPEDIEMRPSGGAENGFLASVTGSVTMAATGATGTASIDVVNNKAVAFKIRSDTTNHVTLDTTDSGVCLEVANGGMRAKTFNDVVVNDGAGTAVVLGTAGTGNGTNAVAIGTGAGLASQGDNTIGIGRNAGATSQAQQAVAIGCDSGRVEQKARGVAVGCRAGEYRQGEKAVAVGDNAGNTDQGANAVAAGWYAGFAGQGLEAIAVGALAQRGGVTLPVVNRGTISIASVAGVGTQTGTPQILASGNMDIGAGSVAADQNDYFAVTITGGDTQTTLSSPVDGVTVLNEGDWVIRGASAWETGGPAGPYAIAVGPSAGNEGQQANAIAIGRNAGKVQMRDNAIAIGKFAGQLRMGTDSIAIGTSTNCTQKNESIALGKGAVTTKDNQMLIGSVTEIVPAVTNTCDLGSSLLKFKDGHFQGDLAVTGNITDPNFTGTVTGLTAGDVGLGNVDNQSKATMFTNPIFTGGTVLPGTTETTDLGSDMKKWKDGYFSGDLAVTGNITDPNFTGTVTGLTADDVGLGNVDNQSKATMFTSPIFTGGTVLPGTTETTDLGSDMKKWKDAYFSGNLSVGGMIDGVDVGALASGVAYTPFDVDVNKWIPDQDLGDIQFTLPADTQTVGPTGETTGFVPAARGVVAWGDYILFSTWRQRFYIYKRTDMTTPISIFYTGGTSTVAMDIVSFSYPYVAAANPEGQPVLVNISNPYQPVGSSYDFNADFTYIPTPPTVVQRFAQVVVVQVPYLYIVVGSNALNVSRTQQLNVYDLSNPAPQLLSTTTLARPPKNYILSSGALYDRGSAQYLVVAGNRAAGSTAEYGQLYIVDITDPYTPIDVGLRRFDEPSPSGQFLKQIRISGNDFYFITHNSDTHKVTVNPNRFPAALEYGLQNTDLGGWNPVTNAPPLDPFPLVGSIGSYYTATVAGTTTPNNPFPTATVIAVGDRIVVDYQGEWSLDTYTEPPRRTYTADPIQTANTIQLLGDYLVMGWNGATAGAACIQVLERNDMQLLARYKNDDPRATGAWWNGDSIYLAGFGSTPASSIFAIKIKSLTPGPVVTASVIAGQANIATDAFVEGTCNSGAVSTRSLLVAGPALIDDKLVVDGPVCGTGSMEVGGDTTLDGKLTVGTDATVDGTIHNTEIIGKLGLNLLRSDASDLVTGRLDLGTNAPGDADFLLFSRLRHNDVTLDTAQDAWAYLVHVDGTWPSIGFKTYEGNIGTIGGLNLGDVLDQNEETPYSLETDSMRNTNLLSNRTIEIKVDGFYKVSYTVNLSTGDDGPLYRIFVAKSTNAGVSYGVQDCTQAVTQKLKDRYDTMSRSCVIPMADGDRLQLRIQSDTVGTDVKVHAWTLSAVRMSENLLEAPINI